MTARSTIRFAVLCALLGASALPTSGTFAQKDTRGGGRNSPAKEERVREDASKKEGRGESAAPNKSEGRHEGASKSGRKGRR